MRCVVVQPPDDSTGENMWVDGVSWSIGCHHGAVDETSLRSLVEQIRSGETSADEAVTLLRRLPFAELADAKIDHHRALRQGLPEAVYGPGKTLDQCVAIVAELLDNGTGPVLVTRVTEAQRTALLAAHPGAVASGGVLTWRTAERRPGVVAVVTAGTADSSVADECSATLTAYGVAIDVVSDVGVAGLHRLLAELDRLTSADIVIVIAGMEGALASVVGGLCARPVIAVPTSVGYGAGLEGVTALLGMLASCAAGVSVVGIDNGYGAAVSAIRALSLATP
jgi:NCAIR mutase (PurE)-related protein